VSNKSKVNALDMETGESIAAAHALESANVLVMLDL